jgi:death-on-curing protein
VVDAIHADQLREHGGLSGVRDENALESALARPRQKWHYTDRTDLPVLAAAYAFGLVRNHPYRDGNKRIGFLALVTFLGLNGHEFHASEADVVTEFVALADGQVSEEALADWTRQHSSKPRAR